MLGSRPTPRRGALLCRERLGQARASASDVCCRVHCRHVGELPVALWCVQTCDKRGVGCERLCKGGSLSSCITMNALQVGQHDRQVRRALLHGLPGSHMPFARCCVFAGGARRQLCIRCCKATPVTTSLRGCWSGCRCPRSSAPFRHSMQTNRRAPHDSAARVCDSSCPRHCCSPTIRQCALQERTARASLADVLSPGPRGMCLQGLAACHHTSVRRMHVAWLMRETSGAAGSGSSQQRHGARAGVRSGGRRHGCNALMRS